MPTNVAARPLLSSEGVLGGASEAGLETLRRLAMEMSLMAGQWQVEGQTGDCSDGAAKIEREAVRVQGSAPDSHVSLVCARCGRVGGRRQASSF